MRTPVPEGAMPSSAAFFPQLLQVFAAPFAPFLQTVHLLGQRFLVRLGPGGRGLPGRFGRGTVVGGVAGVVVDDAHFFRLGPGKLLLPARFTLIRGMQRLPALKAARKGRLVPMAATGTFHAQSSRRQSGANAPCRTIRALGRISCFHITNGGRDFLRTGRGKRRGGRQARAGESDRRAGACIRPEADARGPAGPGCAEARETAAGGAAGPGRAPLSPRAAPVFVRHPRRTGCAPPTPML